MKKRRQVFKVERVRPEASDPHWHARAERVRRWLFDPAFRAQVRREAAELEARDP